MRLHHNDTKALWSLLGIAVVAGFVGGRLEWRHDQIANGNAMGAFAISALGEAQRPIPHFILGFAGDAMLGKDLDASVTKNQKGNYATLFEKATFLSEPDVTFTSLKASTKINSTALPALKAAGVDVVALSTDAANTLGRPVFEDTLAKLQANGLLVCGAGMSHAEAARPAIIEEDGFRIGYLCFSDVGPTDFAATDTTSGILLANDTNFDAIVASAAHDVNALVVSFHWGTEGSTTHDAHQEELAHKAIDAGAALVVGNTAHTVQDVGDYHGKPIVYSIGDFIPTPSKVKVPTTTGFITAALAGPLVEDVSQHTVTIDKNFEPSLKLKDTLTAPADITATGSQAAKNTP